MRSEKTVSCRGGGGGEILALHGENKKREREPKSDPVSRAFDAIPKKGRGGERETSKDGVHKKGSKKVSRRGGRRPHLTLRV